MRKTMLFVGGALVMLLTFLLSPTEARAGGCYEDPIYERNWHGRYIQAAFVRDNACMDGTSIIETVSGGTVIEVIGETDGWYKVRTPEGRTGWTGARLMEITSAALTNMPVVSKAQEELVIAPMYQKCPELEAGQLFKVNGQNAVYLLNKDKKRLYFPNSDVYHTWYEDYSDVHEIGAHCFDDYPIPSGPPFGVNYRPGARLIKRIGSPSVFAILPGNARARLRDAGVVHDLYGENWGSLVRDIDDFFWSNYVAEEEEIPLAIPHDGMLVQEEGDDTVYYVEDGEWQEVEDELPLRLRQDVRVMRQEMIGNQFVKAIQLIFEQLFSDPAWESFGTEQ
ncbi:MAG: SH3 domain-containing protein [Candidatus Magasanikbacteria bacterium]